jgi:hypothetical protein
MTSGFEHDTKLKFNSLDTVGMIFLGCWDHCFGYNYLGLEWLATFVELWAYQIIFANVVQKTLYASEKDEL